MACPGLSWSLLLLLLGAALLADHVTGQALLLSPNRTEHVRFAEKSLFVSCKGRDPVGMVWLGPGGKEIVERSGPVSVEPSTTKDGLKGVDLLLNPVKRKDSGKYRCRARVNSRDEEAEFNLVVLQRIRFREDQMTQYGAVGEDARVHCDVTGDPQPEVDWRGVTRHLEFGPNKKFDIDPETKALIIRNLTREDEGRYRCKATQVSSKDSDLRTADIELKVQYKPEWTGPLQTEVYGYLGGNTNLTCRAEAKPSPDFIWRKGDQIVEGPAGLEPINTENMSVLKITSLEEDMFGEYRCEARNQNGNIEQTIVLIKGQKPAVPQVKVTKTESTQLTLSITMDPEEDRADMYRAEYKTADEPWTSATAVEFKPAGPHVISNLQPDTVYAIRVAALNPAGRGDFSAGLRQRTAARSASTGEPTSSSQRLVLPLLAALLLAALLVL